MHLIETRDLSYTYPGNVTALTGVSFTAPRDSRIAVIGSNGAGKSTLFKCFNGILRPTSGTVLIRGEPITKENIREVRKFVGIVFQNPDDQIFSPTVGQDVAFGPTNLGLDPETIQHRVSEALRLVGIEKLVDRVPHHLSGGEKKRVAIAGIIAMEPQVLIMDEPTAGLDPRGIRELVTMINNLADRYAMTVIFSTHDLSLVPEVADYIYVMHKGHFVAHGTIEEIFPQIEMLRSVSLDAPLFPRLIRALNDDGIPVPMAYTYESTVRALRETYHSRTRVTHD